MTDPYKHAGTHMHAHAHTHAHTITHARMHTHTHTHNDIHENWVLIPAGEEVLWGEEGFQFGLKRWQSWALSKLFREWVPNAGYKVRERAKATSLAFVLLDFSACRCQKKSVVHETIHSEDISQQKSMAQFWISWPHTPLNSFHLSDITSLPCVSFAHRRN